MFGYANPLQQYLQYTRLLIIRQQKTEIIIDWKAQFISRFLELDSSTFWIQVCVQYNRNPITGIVTSQYLVLYLVKMWHSAANDTRVNVGNSQVLQQTLQEYLI